MAVTPSPLRCAFYSIAAFSFFALNDITIKFLGSSYSPVQIVFFAGLASLPLIALHLLADKQPGALRPVKPGWMALRMLIIGINSIVVSYSFANLPLAQAYAIFFLMPLFICLLAALLLGERIDLARGLAVLTGLIGVLIVLRPGIISLQPAHGIALLGGFLGALYYVLLRHSGGAERTAVNILYPVFAQISVAAVLLPSVYLPMSSAHLGLSGLMALLGFIGSLFIIAAYRHAPAYVAAPMQYVQIIWATAFGTLYFEETSDAYTFAGIAVIIASGLYIMTRPTKSEAA